MKFPLGSTVQIARYVAQQQRKGERYPLVLMLEPTLACNIACIGCGKIREYESNKARLSVEECIDAGVQCPAPVVSICGGEPLVYKGIEDVVEGFLELNKNIELCTNALRLEQFLDVFMPSKRLTFVVHLDGMREIHDYICDYPGLWDIAVDAIRKARAAGFRVTTNTTIFKETDPNEVVEMMGYLTDEVGIDGMLVAPGYQYSQIDPNLTMTRAEHEETFRKGRATCSPTESSRPTRRCSTGSSGRSTGRGTTRGASTARFTPASSRRRPSRQPAASGRPSAARHGR
jgi:hopanoid biosynthesis associated radical SAM protein HpnH